MQRHDVVIAGGGLTGVAAGIAAARAGADTLLIERYGFLGGMATAGLVNPFMPHFTAARSEPGQEAVRGIYLELLDRLRAEDALLPNAGYRGNMAFDAEVLKWVLDEMAEESYLAVRFHSFLCGVEARGGHVKSIETVSKSGRSEFTAKVFIDATGDADLAALAGCETVFGREEDGKAQAMTTMFRVAGVDVDRMPSREDCTALLLQAVERGEVRRPGKRFLLSFPYPADGVLTFNQNEIAGRSAVSAEQMSQAEVEGRRAVREMVAFLRRSVPGFERCRVEAIAPQVGVRESRRIVGEHTLTVGELLSQERFPDAVACGAYPVDIHDPDGKKRVAMRHLPVGGWYDIPYRCLVPKGSVNLLAAGRCLSATHEAAAAVRIMPICTAMGQAAGEAAALSIRSGCRVRDVDVGELRGRLLERGAFLGEAQGALRSPTR